MGKKNRKAKAVGTTTDGDTGMPRSVRRECLEIVNMLLDRCSMPFGLRGEEWSDFMEVYEQVEKLRRKQQNYVSASCKRDDHIDSFLTWLHENNVNTDRVCIENFEVEGYGLKAEREIETAELFLAIPRKLMMTTESAQQTVLGKLMQEDRILQSMPNVVLALHLLCEKNTPQSFWMPYIKILPSSYSTPLYFSPDEIQMLKGSPAFVEVLYQFRNITRQYAYFFKLFQGYTDASNLPIKNFCFDDYRWAASTVMTRQNQIPSQTAEQTTLALIPLWDMCNHCNGQITTDFSIEKDCSDCFALRNFDVGEQIFIYYGSRSNAELLVHNGFIYPQNHLDRLAVKLGISKNDSLYSMKAEVLARLSLLPSRIFHLHAGMDPVDSDTLAFLRIFSMDHESLKDRLIGEGAQKLVSQLKVFDCVVSYEVEIKAWAFLETRAQLLLRAYPTTIQEDEVLLEKPELSHHKKLAIQLKMGEKRILQTTQEYAKKQKMLMQTSLEESRREAAKAQLCLEESAQNQQNGEVKDTETASCKENETEVNEVTEVSSQVAKEEKDGEGDKKPGKPATEINGEEESVKSVETETDSRTEACNGAEPKENQADDLADQIQNIEVVGS